MRAGMALLVGNASGAAMQVLSVPVFLLTWGPQLYGEWLILFTIPGYLALADFGLVSVAANRVDQLCARQDFALARRVHDTATVLLLMFFAAVALSLGIVALALRIPLSALFSLIPQHTILPLAGVLLVDALLALFLNHQAALFRSVQRYEVGLNWQTVSRLLALAGLVTGAALGAGPLLAATGMLALRLLCMILLLVHLRLRVIWLGHARWSMDRREVRGLLGLSASYMVLPLSNAFYLHVTTLLVGLNFGAPAVAAFSVLRSFTRLIPVMVSIVGRAVWAEVARAPAGRLVADVGWASVALTVLAIGAYITMGPWAFGLLTHGEIALDMPLFIAFLGQAALIAIYTTLEVFVLARNRHTGYALMFLGNVLMQVCLGWVFLPILGPLAFPLFGAIGAALVCLSLLPQMRRAVA